MNLNIDQRRKVIDKIIEDMVESARGDFCFASDFIRDAMNNGYEPLNELSNDVLLQMYRDAFDEEFEP